jgi:uncharacterized protein YndB with AHSA1/START domain
MTTVARTIDAPPDEVFAVLVTPATYPSWLVGCKEIRATEPGWPAPGTRFHHRVGLMGPLTVADSTKVLEIDPPRRLVLEVRVRPVGRGRVTFSLDAAGPGTRLAFDEVPIGAMRFLAAVLDPLTRARNTKSLDRLAEHVEAPARAG